MNTQNATYPNTHTNSLPGVRVSHCTDPRTGNDTGSKNQQWQAKWKADELCTFAREANPRLTEHNLLTLSEA